MEPDTVPKTLEARSLAFPNLSHLVNAMVLMMVSVSPIITSINDRNSSLRKAKMPITPQTKGVRYSQNQNMFESTGLICLSGLAVSKTHMLSPLSSVSFHQRSPTRSRPLMFLTFQKSAANSKITVMNSRMLVEYVSVDTARESNQSCGRLK